MGQPMPYQPMGPRSAPAGDAELERMMTKLAVRSRVPVAEPEKEPLRWQEPVKTGLHGTGYMLSACGRFSIVKTSHELGFTYSAWDLSTKNTEGGMATLLECKTSKEQAIACCEAAR